MSVVEAPRLLEPVEQDYVRHVAWHLRDVERKQRQQLIEDTGAHLCDRPAPDNEQALWDELGPPEQYASELRIAHGLHAERTDWWARWLAIPRRRRWMGTAFAIVVLAALVAASLTARWWVLWHADVKQFESGITWSDSSGLAEQSDSGIERREKFDSRVIMIEVNDRRDVVLTLGILMNRTPLRVTIPALERATDTDHPPVTVVSSTIHPQIGTGPDGVEVVPNAYIVEIHLRATCDLPVTAPGSHDYGYSFGSVHVDYKGLGRARSSDLQLLDTVQFQWADGACTS